ncbi:MAG: hypothetical protein LBT97_14015 [Planctomycetota bacterium]|jgi:hypothetical protein|nr:hypothetical protein [Planctomycetota bacterium]
MNSDSQTVRDVIFGEIRLSMDLWRRHPDANLSEEASEILAAWAHAHRLPCVADPEWEALDSLVRSDFQALCSAAEGHDDPGGWREDLLALVAAAEDALPGAGMDACADAALELFNRLDQAQLAAWAMRRLGHPGAVDFFKKWLPADRSFRDNLMEFVPIGNYVGVMNSAYRTDLGEFDSDLDLVTAKYRLALREIEENDPEAAPSPEIMETLKQLAGDARAVEVAGIPDKIRVTADRFTNNIISLLDTWQPMDGISMAADVENGDGSILVAVGGGWQAHADGVEKGDVRFHVLVDGLPCAEGELRVGALAGEVKDGTVVFPWSELRKAVAEGGTPVLKRAGRESAGTWKNA